MKPITQMVLFAGMSLEGKTEGVVVTESFRKAGKNWKGKKDKNGFALDDSGQRIKTADTMKFLPVKSKNNDDMADATGLKGESLKLHNIDVRSRGLREVYKMVTDDVAEGHHMLVSCRVGTDGVKTIKYKPTAIRIVGREMTDEEVLKRADEIKAKAAAEAAAKK